MLSKTIVDQNTIKTKKCQTWLKNKQIERTTPITVTKIILAKNANVRAE
jgi:hypothetical protein